MAATKPRTMPRSNKPVNGKGGRLANLMKKAKSPMFLLAWIASAFAVLSSPHTKFKAMRFVDLPFVFWIQRPKNANHQFVIHGFGQSWAPMLALEVAYACAYATRHLLITRLLLLPLALYYWILFNRIAQAEQRLRVSKGKTISWEEYLCIYIPFALKAGFLASSAFINLTAIVAFDLSLPQWIQLPTALVTQVCLFMLGAYGTAAQDSFITLGWTLWGINGQPIEVPHFVSLPTFLLIVTRGIKSAMRWARKQSSSIRVQKTTQRFEIFEAMVVAAMLRIVRTVRSLKVQLTSGSSSSSSSRPASSSPSLFKSSAVKNITTTTTAAATSIRYTAKALSKRLRLPPSFKIAPALVLGFLIGAQFGKLLQPRYQSILPYGNQLHVGESLKYRCSFIDLLSPLSCTDLELSLSNDGILSLYAQPRSTRSYSPSSFITSTSSSSKNEPSASSTLLWRSKSKKNFGLSDQYVAQVDERSRLAISLHNQIIFQTPRLVSDPQLEPVAGTLSIDGVLRAFYITDGPHDQGLPTFVSTW